MHRFNHMKHAIILLGTSCVLTAGETFTQDAIGDTASGWFDGWEFASAFYAPLMGLEGSVGLAGIAPTDVDISFSDLLDDMDAGLSGAFTMKKGPWSLALDGIWLKLSDDVGPAPGARLLVGQEQFTGSLAVGHEIHGTRNTSISFVAGGTANHIKLDLELSAFPAPSLGRSGSQTWVDPWLGLRFRQRLGERWTAFGDFQYGGFGVSSEEYWQVVAGLGYRIGENTILALAYRAISVDYRQGGFVYDTVTSGPNIGLIVEF